MSRNEESWEKPSLKPSLYSRRVGRELRIASSPVPMTGCKGRGATGPHAGRAEPEPCGRAREPPCCWRQQLSDEPRTKNPPHHQQTASSCLVEAINEPTALSESPPCSPQSPGPAPATVITFCLPRFPLPVQLGRARALMCSPACPVPGPAGGCFRSRLCFAAEAPPSTALQQTRDAPGFFSPLPDL